MSKETKQILVTGGAGYVGSKLVPALLAKGHRVRVLDLYLYGEDVFEKYNHFPEIEEIKGDIRDQAVVKQALKGCDAVIHLACISNDPSFELNPLLGKSINYDAFRPLVRLAKQAGVKRFIYASSSSVYGIKDTPEVTEDMDLEPLTDYSKYKAMCEGILTEEREPGFVTLIVRPATICGYAPRLRLDLIVNMFTAQAIENGKITVFGGDQVRPNLHIDDMVGFYVRAMYLPDDLIDGQIFNVGNRNMTVLAIAETAASVATERRAEIEVLPTDDPRSYHIFSGYALWRLNFWPLLDISNAVTGLADAFASGQIPDAMTDPRYYNVKTMQNIGLK